MAPGDLGTAQPFPISPFASSERLGALLDTAPDAMVAVEQSGRIIFVNLQTERLFGYQRAELLGQPLEILIPERFRSVHGLHMDRFLSSPSARAMGSGLELRGRHRSGDEIPIEVSLGFLDAGGDVLVSASIRDITERQRVEAAARLNGDRLIGAVENIEDGLALFDAEHRLVLCNGTYRSLLGMDAAASLVEASYESLTDDWLRTLDHAGEGDADRLRAASAVAADRSTTEFDVRTRDGRRFRASVRRTVEGGLVETLWDLTDEERRAAELRDARATAEAANAAKSEFLSSMSHELRTPLNAILGFAQLLQRDRKAPLDGRQHERVSEILKGGEHLLKLIDDILDLARIEAGGVSISTEPVDIVDVLNEVKTLLEPAASRAEVRLSIAPLPSPTPTLSVDRTRFAQILMNFGSNSIKYNRPGGTITFGVSVPSGGFVRLTVSDTGIGVPTDKQGSLFQPFQRAGQETGSIQGTGIGLAITKRLAVLMGGTVGFRSVPSRGSDFWVDLPIHTSSSRASSRPPESRDVSLLEERRGVILYVEDNPANINLMEHMLDGFEGLELVSATTAEAGLEIARSRKVDIVIMDINLPGMSGFDALHALREVPETRGVRVIALSAAATSRDLARGRAAGFDRYLTKPVKLVELEAVLAALLPP